MSSNANVTSARQAPRQEAAPAIVLEGIGKTFRMYQRPVDRLFYQLPGLARFSRYQEIRGLHPLDLTIRRGEVVGLVGRNGAGKSTLLQLVCNTLPPTQGNLQVNGKIAALLELGAGFNPEFTGRENVYLSASIAGLTRREIDARFDSIAEFSGIGNFIDQPVKTYSSGMYVRLAFAVATSVSPDILVVDEALSVGDGAFARQSFDRIMALRDAGATILFCSHSLYQVEALCDRALWIEGGEVMADGKPSVVVPRYQQFLDAGAQQGRGVRDSAAEEITQQNRSSAPSGQAHLTGTQVWIDGSAEEHAEVESGVSTLDVDVSFASDPTLPCPTIAVTISTPDGRIVTSAGSWEDGAELERDAQGRGGLRLSFPHLSLLKGEYWVGAYLFCERGLHSYEWVDPVSSFMVRQQGVARGVVALPRRWQAIPASLQHEQA